MLCRLFCRLLFRRHFGRLLVVEPQSSGGEPLLGSQDRIFVIDLGLLGIGAGLHELVENVNSR
jgi:hypothetical protein